MSIAEKSQIFNLNSRETVADVFSTDVFKHKLNHYCKTSSKRDKSFVSSKRLISLF